MTCNGIHRHKAVWYSSRQLWHNDDNRSRTFSVNANVLSAILVTGMQYQKYDNFCKALNLRGLSKTAFCRHQKYACGPVIERCFLKQQKLIMETVKKENLTLVLAGDGKQYDATWTYA